jgi:hypothetical protein
MKRREFGWRQGRRTLRSAIAFEDVDPATQQSLRELGQHYFDDEFIPRLEGMINIPRYEEAMHEKTASDRAFIDSQFPRRTAWDLTPSIGPSTLVSSATRHGVTVAFLKAAGRGSISRTTCHWL